MTSARCDAPADVAADGFAEALATAQEQAPLMPRAALHALHALETLQAGSDGQLARVLIEESRIHAGLGEQDAALDAAVRAEQLGRDLHDDTLQAEAMLAHANVLSNLVHDLDAADRLVMQAAQRANRSHDMALQARALLARALLTEEDGQVEKALQTAALAVTAARASAEPRVLSLALRTEAQLLSSRDRYAEALARIDEVNALAHAAKRPARVAEARLAEYAIAAHAGNAKRAERALDAAVDVLQKLHAKESLVLPLVNLAELYTQQMRYGEAARTSDLALRTARQLGDERGERLAAFQSGIADIHFRNIAAGKAVVETALAALQDDDRYLPMLLEYGHALGTVGEADGALTIYRKASAISRADWRRGQRLSYVTLQQAYDNERKKGELAALRHESALKAAALQTERRMKAIELHTAWRIKAAWVAFSAAVLLAAIAIALLYRRVASTNRLLNLKNEELFRQSTRDSLTGLFNRHYFYQHVVPSLLDHGAGHPERRTHAHTAGVFLLLDIDRFKSINDTHGHGAGDVVLKLVAARLAAALREQDVLIRWGGEEFLAFLPEVATEEARRVCSRLLTAMSGKPIPIDGGELNVTISIGFCPKPAASDEMGWEQLVHLADLCLYLAKTAGRNQAFGIDDASALTPGVFAAADSDLRQASTDGLVGLVNVKTPPVPSQPSAVG